MGQRLSTMVPFKNGWMTLLDTMAVWGNFYLKRAMVAMAPKPAVDAPTRAMLTSSLIGSKDGLGLSLMLPLGQYQILVYVMETGLTNSRACDLELNGELAAEGLGALASGAWARYGPYPVTITCGTL